MLRLGVSRRAAPSCARSVAARWLLGRRRFRESLPVSCQCGGFAGREARTEAALKTPQMAERGGFEPPDDANAVNGFRDRRFQPLSHLSAGEYSG